MVTHTSVIGGVNWSFCSGKNRVVEIVDFTEPGDSMGMRVSQVNYRVKAVDLADWTQDEQLQASYAANFKQMDKAERATALVLTSEGWKVKNRW